MVAITHRVGLSRNLTAAEVDTNFDNLNDAVTGGGVVAIASSMTPRQMTVAVQAALDAADAAGGSTVRVVAPAGTILYADDWLRLGSNTELIFPEWLQIVQTANTANVPVFTRTLSSGAITAVGVSSQPGGYHTAPQVFATGSQFEPATVYAFVDQTTKTVTDVFIENGGRGYHSAPTSVEFWGFPRSDFIGSSLSRKPNITLSVSGGKVTGYTIVDPGANLYFTGLIPLRVKGGIHARMTASINSTGDLTGVSISQGGVDHVTVRPVGTKGATTQVQCVGGNPKNRAPLFTNKDWFNGNKNIVIRGGIWDGGLDQMNYAYTTFEHNGMGALFISCDHTKLYPAVTRNFQRYCFHFVDCWDVFVDNHYTDNGFDNLHLTGPNRWVTCAGITGATGDDMYTCTTLERDVMDFYAGDILYVDIRGVKPTGTSFLLATWNGQRPDSTCYRIDHIDYEAKGLPTQLLLRVNNVEETRCATGIGRIRLTAQLDGPETFTGTGVRTPVANQLVQVQWCNIDRFELNLRHSLRRSANTITPMILAVTNNGSIRSTDIVLDVDWASAASSLQHLVSWSSTTAASPEDVRITGAVRCGADSGISTFIASFHSTRCPTKLLDLSDLVATNISVAQGLNSVPQINISGMRVYNSNNSSGKLAYEGTVYVTAYGVIADGTMKLFTSSAAGAALHWYGGGNRLLNGAEVHSSNTAKFYPRDRSLAIRMSRHSASENFGKIAGVEFTNGGLATPYGMPNTAGPIMVLAENDGTLWYTDIGSGTRAMVATIVSGGTGYTANDLLTVSSGTWTSPPIIKVLTAPAGVVATVEVSYSGLWGKTRPTGTQTVTGGTGANNATFTLAPL